MASRTTRSQHLVCLLVVSVAVTWLYSALLEPIAFTSHEGIYIYARTQQVAVELAAGRLPQSFPDAYYGAGFAFPRFYPPLTLFLSAGLALLVGGVVVAVNLTFFLSVLASGFSMYAMTVGILRNRWIALGASLLYVSMPYRFVDIYVRAALAEAWTFVWYPLILLGLWRAVTRRTMPWYLPVSICALVLTHNITAVYFLAYCGLFTLCAMALRGWRIGIIPGLAVGLGIMLGMWFLLPQQYYIPSVWVADSEFMWTNAAHVQEHRVLPWQFFYSHPKYWFGETGGPGYADGMSYELGIGQLLLLPLGLLMAKSYRWRERMRRSPVLAVLGTSAIVGYAVSIVFMMYPIVFLAVLPKQFAFIQFPWRLLAVTAFLGPIIGAVVVSRLGHGRPWLVPAFAAAAVLVVLFVPGFQSTPQTEPYWTENRLLTPEEITRSGDRGYTVLGEYVPREIDIADLNRNGLPPALYVSPVILEGESASIDRWTRKGPDFDVSAIAPSGALIRIPLFYYDFYVAASGEGVPLDVSSSAGFLTVRVPAGRTTFTIRQSITPVTRFGLACSGVALVAIIASAFAFRDRRTRPKQD